MIKKKKSFSCEKQKELSRLEAATRQVTLDQVGKDIYLLLRK